MKIYTKTGDSGETSLFDGSRVSKSHDLVDVYGEVDTLNSLIGLAVSTLDHKTQSELIQELHTCQKTLFALGAKLANPQQIKQKNKADFGEDKITYLENSIDRMDAQLTPLTSFILPGGTQTASVLHLARCQCRQAERKLVKVKDKFELPEIYIHYLNRLSDYLFVIARYANHVCNRPDVPWI